MRKQIFILFLGAGLLVTGQSKNIYQLDTEKSVINWKGSYSFQFSEHNGTVKFEKGSLLVQNGNISGGSFTIDMQSITNEDYLIDRGPVKHLKDSDFFDVERFPKASLKITSVTYYQDTNSHEILADLTIKGITKPIKFYPTLVDEAKQQINARLKIDRTRWGITYNNKLKNHAISDAIEFDILLLFK